MCFGGGGSKTLNSQNNEVGEWGIGKSLRAARAETGTGVQYDRGTSGWFKPGSPLSQTSIPDEAAARKTTRRARIGVANINDKVQQRDKRRGGLRIDRSTTISGGGGSGPTIPN